MKRKLLAFILALSLVSAPAKGLDFSVWGAETAKITYEFENMQARGFAQGRIELTGEDGLYYLYWSDDSKALEGYYEIDCVEVKDGKGEYEFLKNIAIPVDATSVIAFKSGKENVERLKRNADAVYELPGSKIIEHSSKDKTLSFEAISDTQLDQQSTVFYDYSLEHFAMALEDAAQRNVDFITSSGDCINNYENGTSKEWQTYQKLIANSSFANPVFETNGNHSMKSDVNYGLEAYIQGTGLGIDSEQLGNVPYYEITAKNGDHFLFVALQGTSAVNEKEDFTKEQMDWLEEKLKIYSADRKHRIFIFEHAFFKSIGPGDDKVKHYYGGALKGGTEQNARFINLMREYKDVFLYTGHSHFDFMYNWNYDDENGTMANMFHVPSTACTSHVKKNSDGNYKISYEMNKHDSQCYIVDCYEDMVITNGLNVVDNMIYPEYSYIVKTDKPKEKSESAVKNIEVQIDNQTDYLYSNGARLFLYDSESREHYEVNTDNGKVVIPENAKELTLYRCKGEWNSGLESKVDEGITSYWNKYGSTTRKDGQLIFSIRGSEDYSWTSGEDTDKSGDNAGDNVSEKPDVEIANERFREKEYVDNDKRNVELQQYYLRIKVAGNSYTNKECSFDINGNLIIKFAGESTVYVKSLWDESFMTSGAVGKDKKEAILYKASEINNPDRMTVPAGTVVFSLIKNNDGTLKLSYRILGADALNDEMCKPDEDYYTTESGSDALSLREMINVVRQTLMDDYRYASYVAYSKLKKAYFYVRNVDLSGISSEEKVKLWDELEAALDNYNTMKSKNNIVTMYVTDSASWGDVRAYFYNSISNKKINTFDGAQRISYIRKVGSSNTYAVTINQSKWDKVVFRNSDGKQTVNIDVPGKNSIGYMLRDNNKTDGKYVPGKYVYTYDVCNDTAAKLGLGHKIVIDKAVEATYEECGLTEGSHCGVCNKVFEMQKVIPKLEKPETTTEVTTSQAETTTKLIETTSREETTSQENMTTKPMETTTGEESTSQEDTTREETTSQEEMTTQENTTTRPMETTTGEESTSQEDTTREETTSQEEMTTQENTTTRPMETTTKNETTKRQQETTGKEDETTKRQQETTGKEDETTKGQQETTRKEDETTKKTVVSTKKIKLNKTNMSLVVGQVFVLKATKLPVKSSGAIKWKSSNSKIVKIIKNGKIKALKSGSAVITAYTGTGVKATCRVTVKKAPYKVMVNKRIIILKKGKNFQLKATIPKFTYTSIKYITSNKKISAVSQKGVIKAVNVGMAIITVKTLNNKVARTMVIVKK